MSTSTRSGSLVTQKHPIIFRVTRLTPPQPSLRPESAASFPETSPSAFSWGKENVRRNLQSSTSSNEFGRIYSGETFRVQVTICHVAVKSRTRIWEPVFHLQDENGSKPVSVMAKEGETGVMEGDQFLTRVVELHMDKSGKYGLVCSIKYQDVSGKDGAGVAAILRQVFRFDVSNSLEIKIIVRNFSRKSTDLGMEKHNESNISPLGRRWLVEVCIRNFMMVPVDCWQAEIVTNRQGLKSRCVGGNTWNESRPTENEDMEGPVSWIKISTGRGDIKGFLFEVVEDVNMEATDKPDGVLGSLDISWRTFHGIFGKLNRVTLIKAPSTAERPIDIKIFSIPSAIRINSIFSAICLATNNTSRNVRLRLCVRRKASAAILPAGANDQNLGELVPGAQVECSVVFIPVRQGLHAIDGISVFDVDTEKTYGAQPPLIRVS